MAAEAILDFQGRDESLIQDLDRVQSHVSKWSSAVKGLATTALAAFSGAAIFDFLKTAVTESESATAAVNRLQVSFEANGNAAGVTAEEIKKLAGDLQAVTVYADDVTVAAAGTLSAFKNIKGDIFKEALKSAQDFATFTGTDLDAAVSKLGAALDTPTKALSSLRREGIKFTEAQANQIKEMEKSGNIAKAQQLILDQLAGTFGGAAANQAKTFTGFMSQLANRTSDVAESVGNALVPALNGLTSVVSKVSGFVAGLVENFTSTDTVVGGFVNGALKLLVDTFWLVLEAGVKAFTSIEVVITNFGQTARAVFWGVQLGAVTLFEEIKHSFTVKIPAYLNYFWENWKNIFENAYNYVTTIFTNMLTNISEFFKAVWAYLNGDEFDFTWTSLTEGFENTLKELPVIAEREMSDLEKRLTKQFEGAAKPLADAFQQKFAQNMAALGLDPETGRPKQEAAAGPGKQDSIFSSIGDKLTGGLSALGKAAADLRKGVLEGLSKVEGVKADEEEKGGVQSLTALFQKIQGSAAEKRTEKLQEQTVQNTAKTVLVLDKVAKAQKDTEKAIFEGLGKLVAGKSNFLGF